MTAKCLESRKYMPALPPFNRKCSTTPLKTRKNYTLTETLFLSEENRFFFLFAQIFKNTELAIEFGLLICKFSYQQDFGQPTWPLCVHPTGTKNPSDISTPPHCSPASQRQTQQCHHWCRVQTLKHKLFSSQWGYTTSPGRKYSLE